MAGKAYAEQFSHGADIGVRGTGPTRAAAFEGTALALASDESTARGFGLRQGDIVLSIHPALPHRVEPWLERP